MRSFSAMPYQPPPPPPLPDDDPGGVDADDMADEKLFPIVKVKCEGENAAVPGIVPTYHAGL